MRIWYGALGFFDSRFRPTTAPLALPWTLRWYLLPPACPSFSAALSSDRAVGNRCSLVGRSRRSVGHPRNSSHRHARRAALSFLITRLFLVSVPFFRLHSGAVCRTGCPTHSAGWSVAFGRRDRGCDSRRCRRHNKYRLPSSSFLFFLASLASLALPLAEFWMGLDLNDPTTCAVKAKSP
jgi:hypothetical protein